MVTQSAPIVSRWARRLWALLPSMGVLAMAVIAALSWMEPARAEILLKDAVGREVRLASPARRIVTNESLLLYYLALIDPDPVARIAGWARPQRIDGGVYRAFREKFPGIDAIPEVGSVVPSNAPAEAILGVRPDLFVVSLWQPEWEEIAGSSSARVFR